MPELDRNFLQNMAAFTDESMCWCSEEAEKSILLVLESLEAMFKDSEYLPEIMEKVAKSTEQLHDKSEVNAKPVLDVAQKLKSICVDDAELRSLLEPIVGTLQFQDRTRQQLECIIKMLHIWLVERETCKNGVALNQEKVLDFGQKLLDATVTAEERKVIRKHIAGLPEEDSIEEDMVFF